MTVAPHPTPILALPVVTTLVTILMTILVTTGMAALHPTMVLIILVTILVTTELSTMISHNSVNRLSLSLVRVAAH
jgi:hypothetical protein